jgi:hypothetical protein
MINTQFNKNKANFNLIRNKAKLLFNKKYSNNNLNNKLVVENLQIYNSTKNFLILINNNFSNV